MIHNYNFQTPCASLKTVISLTKAETTLTKSNLKNNKKTAETTKGNIFTENYLGLLNNQRLNQNCRVTYIQTSHFSKGNSKSSWSSLNWLPMPHKCHQYSVSKNEYRKKIQKMHINIVDNERKFVRKKAN